MIGTETSREALQDEREKVTFQGVLGRLQESWWGRDPASGFSSQLSPLPRPRSRRRETESQQPRVFGKTADAIVSQVSKQDFESGKAPLILSPPSKRHKEPLRSFSACVAVLFFHVGTLQAPWTTTAIPPGTARLRVMMEL